MKTLTTKETAERLGVTVRRVNDLITTGRLPAARFGRAYMVNEADLKLVEVRRPGRPRKGQSGKASNRRVIRSRLKPTIN